MTWQPMALRDCVTFKSGGTPNKGRPEYWNGDIPWVSSGEMSEQFINDTTLHITEAGAEAGSRLVPEGTVFAVVRGMSLAKEFRVSYATRTMAFNQDLKALTTKDGIDSYFLFSSLRAYGSQIRDLATEAAHGTKKLEMERLESFVIQVPDFQTQQFVAELVRNYDELIETNRRRIALLEESARLLYREWFVNLRFPGHEQAKAIDGLPVGWSRKTIAEMASMLNRGITPKYDDAAPGLVINQKCIRDGRLSLALARNQSKEVRADRLVQVGDVLINSTGTGTLGRVAQVRAPISDCTVDTHVTIVRPLETDSIGFFGVALLELEPVFTTMGVGATNQTELGRADIGALRLLVSPPEIRKEFHDRVWPIFEQIETLSQANLRMAQARDELLPRLMSGAIQV